ncbi:probable C-mannosyltransferase DPY19L3 isoform X1 [Argonauta hians]
MESRQRKTSKSLGSNNNSSSSSSKNNTKKKNSSNSSSSSSSIISSNNNNKKKKTAVSLPLPPHPPSAVAQCASVLWLVAGLCAALWAGYVHAHYMATLHDNNLWFSNIKEVEQEISFRTESGLYYSYYKQLVNASSLSEGISSLTRDNLTEHPSTINVLERMNIYQEVVLAGIYRTSTLIQRRFKPIFFYINTIFALHGLLVSSLFVTAWILSGSWMAGVLTACFYIFNRLDTTRVEYVIPLRESFSLPFLWLQVAALSYYFRHNTNPVLSRLCVVVLSLSTLAFTLFWQFGQFIILLQVFSLFAVWLLGFLPHRKVMVLLAIQLCSLLLVCALQFCNPMILGSLAVSFILSFLVLLQFKNYLFSVAGVWWQLVKVGVFAVASLLLMVGFNRLIKLIIVLDADEHIFKFLLTKFGLGYYTDFDSQLYLCNGAFGFLEWDTIERLCEGFVFPIYVVCHLALVALVVVSCFAKWSRKEAPTTSEPSHHQPLLFARPEMVFHTVQALLFGALAVSTLRMKYLWTPYMCVLASVALADHNTWKTLLAKLTTGQPYIVFLCRHFVVGSVLASLLYTALPSVYKELEDLKEFWDPDTVELMEWIKSSTAPVAAFSGSMQLMAGVKLCTGRAVTNHPHYEHKMLRHKTRMLYQMYGRKPPEEVHQILRRYKTTHIILEDSICLAPPRGGCRTPDLIDVANGELPDDVSERPGLVKNSRPRFCIEVRRGGHTYSKYFRLVFENRTFRVYRLQ